MQLPNIEQNEPLGKRSLRTTIYGNINGYIGGKFWLTLGPNDTWTREHVAPEWLAGEQLKPKGKK